MVFFLQCIYFIDVPPFLVRWSRSWLLPPKSSLFPGFLVNPESIINHCFSLMLRFYILHIRNACQADWGAESTFPKNGLLARPFPRHPFPPPPPFFFSHYWCGFRVWTQDLTCPFFDKFFLHRRPRSPGFWTLLSPDDPTYPFSRPRRWESDRTGGAYSQYFSILVAGPPPVDRGEYHPDSSLPYFPAVCSWFFDFVRLAGSKKLWDSPPQIFRLGHSETFSYSHSNSRLELRKFKHIHSTPDLTLSLGPPRIHLGPSQFLPFCPCCTR